MAEHERLEPKPASASAAGLHKCILDIGCGDGWLLAEAPAAATRRLRVGVDLSMARLLDSRHFNCLRFVAADGTALPFRDASFDEVIGHVSLPYMNTSATLREIYRVLVPGGDFVVTVHTLAYVRRRFVNSLRKGLLRDSLFMCYVTANGLLNHRGLAQLRWFRGRFETFNTVAGVTKAADQVGFSCIRAHRWPTLNFFGVTGRKPDREGNHECPDPKWFFDAVVPRRAIEARSP